LFVGQKIIADSGDMLALRAYDYNQTNHPMSEKAQTKI
jgi:hypothetical protein